MYIWYRIYVIYSYIRKAYKLELTSQKCTYYEQKLNACGNNTRNICKTVNSILGSTIKQKHNALTASLMYTSYVKFLSYKLSCIYDCIKYMLVLSPSFLTAHHISQPIGLPTYINIYIYIYLVKLLVFHLPQ